jgi:RNA 2',3'-cyclic 3'-phosphodiesterase
MATPAAQSIRAFIGIPLEAGPIAALQKIQQQLGADLPEGAVRWVKSEQLHLTLKFLGDVSRDRLDELAAALQRACAGIPPFQLRLEGAGCFPHQKNPRVVWIGIGGTLEPLRKLQEQIDHETPSFGDHTEARAFQPHLTIGRVRAFGKAARHVGERVARARVAALSEWNVREIHLVQSELAPTGSRYTFLATVPLRSAD